MNIREQFNLNTVISLGAIAVQVAMALFVYVVWGSLTKANENIQSMSEKIATAVANQANLQKTLELTTSALMPRPELELRFKAIEVEQQAIKTRVQQTDAALIRLRESKSP